jgi:hypothetical protein
MEMRTDCHASCHQKRQTHARTQAGREPEGYRDSEVFKLCQRGMETLRLQMREARQSGGLLLCVRAWLAQG